MQTSQHESVSDLTRQGAALAFFTAYDDLDTARMIGLASPAATVHFLPMGDSGKGSFWEFGKGVWDTLIDGFPELHNTVDQLTTAGNIVTARVTIGGQQVKDCLGVQNKGFSFSSDHVFIFQFNDADQIDHLTIDWDHAHFVQQLSGEQG